VLLIPKRHGQTDGRTDGQTDGRLTVALPRSALASRGKKRKIVAVYLRIDAMNFTDINKLLWRQRKLPAASALLSYLCTVEGKCFWPGICLTCGAFGLGSSGLQITNWIGLDWVEFNAPPDIVGPYRSFGNNGAWQSDDQGWRCPVSALHSIAR